MHLIENNNGYDPKLWELAKKRVGFKNHLLSFIVVNIMLWVLYFLTDHHEHEDRYWPLWVGFSWGIGLLFHFIGAYIRPINSVENEYERLKNKENRL